jgi:hypothetical protein
VRSDIDHLPSVQQGELAIVLTPNEGGLEIDVQGDLAGILTIASNAKSPAASAAGHLQVSLVAGTRFHLNLRSQSNFLNAVAASVTATPTGFSRLFRAAT